MPPPAPKPEPEDETWLATYADAITLLMAFFVLLVSVSKVDLALFEEVAEGINEKVNKKERISPLKELSEDAAEIVQEMTDGKALRLGVDDTGIVLEFDSSAFFLPGSAQIRPEALPVIQSVTELVNSPKYLDFNMDVEGHTDDDPISNLRFPSNWELAGGRSSSVVRKMIELGTDPLRLRVLSYGPTRPKVPNRTEDGTPIPENKAQNRRVVVRIHQQSINPSPPKYLPVTSIARDFIEPGTQQNPSQSNSTSQALPAPTRSQ